jgi:two-component system cell cycle response regulator DivK
LQQKTVLVVEDNRDELMIYATLLTHRGYQVLTATDYESGVKAARERNPDVAVIDVNLGSTSHDGTDLIRTLRQTETTSSIPIIAHTAFGDVYRESLSQAGCDRILHKPTNPNALLQALEELIGPPAE